MWRRSVALVFGEEPHPCKLRVKSEQLARGTKLSRWDILTVYLSDPYNSRVTVTLLSKHVLHLFLHMMYMQASFHWLTPVVKFTSTPAAPRFPLLPSTWKATTHSTGSRTKRKCLTFQSHASTWCAPFRESMGAACKSLFSLSVYCQEKLTSRDANVCTICHFKIPHSCVCLSHLELSQWGVCSFWW